MDAVEAKRTYPSSNSATSAKLTQNAGSGNSLPDETASDRKPRPLDCGNIEMRIARDGTWLYRESPIGRPSLVKLFASVLRRGADGRYWLVTPAERCRIEVEDVPFLAVALTVEGEGRGQKLIFRTNLDEFVTAGTDRPLRVETAASGEPAPYILVRKGLEARLARPVFYELVELGTEERIGERTQFGVWSEGTFFPLGEPIPGCD